MRSALKYRWRQWSAQFVEKIDRATMGPRMGLTQKVFLGRKGPARLRLVRLAIDRLSMPGFWSKAVPES
jgi:hypothetical protein